jgi:hypothetical protein
MTWEKIAAKVAQIQKILEAKAAGAITSTVSPGTATTEGLVSKPKYSVEEEEDIEPKMEHWNCD